MKPSSIVLALCLCTALRCGGELSTEAVQAELLDTQGKPIVTISASVVTTASALREGLRGYPELDLGQGLLLRFPVEDTVCITNSGVAFSIEAVYVSTSGRVIAVEAFDAGEVAPRCHGRTAMVLELRPGQLGERAPFEMRLFGEGGPSDKPDRRSSP